MIFFLFFMSIIIIRIILPCQYVYHIIDHLKEVKYNEHPKDHHTYGGHLIRQWP